MGLRSLYIDGTISTGTEITIKNDWTIEETINRRSTFSFTIKDNNSVSIDPLKEIYFYDDTTLIWAGVIDKVEIKELVTDYLVEFNCDASDFTALCERKLAVRGYKNQTFNYIIQDLINNYLTEYGITLVSDPIVTTIVEINFNYSPVDNCLNLLASFGNYVWWITKDKEMYFIDISNTSVSTTSLTNVFNFTYYKDTNNYRNYQYVKGKAKKTIYNSQKSLTPACDGHNREYFCKYPIAEEPLIETNIGGAGWTVRSLGYTGVSEEGSADFFWHYQSNQISHDESDSVLTGADSIRISYYGLIPLLTVTQNTAEITDHGEIQNYISNSDLITIEECRKFAVRIIEKYSNDAEYCHFTLQTKDYEIGELVAITKSIMNINSNFLIDSISWRPQGVNDITYRYKGIDGAGIGGWEEFFKNLYNPPEIQRDEEGETVIAIEVIAEDHSHDGEWDLTRLTPLYPATNLYPSTSLYPGTIIATVNLTD